MSFFPIFFLLDEIRTGQRERRLLYLRRPGWYSDGLHQIRLVQGRFAFILAYAYNHIEKNEEWLRACKNGIDFIEKHCFDTDGRMFFEVTAAGIPVRKRRYVFSETFAAIAMAHYALASGDKGYAEKAVNLFKQVLHHKNTPGLLGLNFVKVSWRKATLSA